ncbi:MAG TPA: selenide, water dikinase SelD [Gemmatimonadaceae bacterium]|nr:selenide, water dikinase SelD [Gemmatimonadaceae bacterium]
MPKAAPAVTTPIRLTEYARCAGCAAKMGAGDLSRALAPLPSHEDPRLIVGRETFDDAGVFVLGDDLALVQTVDFFAPIVDDPYDFGRVAAANALSDVFAMGGEPLTALNIVGFPAGKLPLEILTDILRGGGDMVRQAGAVLVGGHSIIDEELKYGLSVTGRVHPQRLLTNAAARPGDVLLLTKPLGTGILSTAAKRGELAPADYATLLETMTTLNAAASRAALAVGGQCATDVTGFGLLGHASHIARASNVTLHFERARIPELPGARASWRLGATTGGADRNLAYLEGRVNWGAVSAEDRALLLDPQTSGGLLVALSRDRVADFCARVPSAVVVGEVEPRAAWDLVIA